MGADGPEILSCDDAADLQLWIAEICGISHYAFLTGRKEITRGCLERNFDKILHLVEGWGSHIAFQVLGVFILKTGAQLPKDIKEKIIKSADWNIERNWGWVDYIIELRKFYLKDFQDKIKRHTEGKITHLVNLKMESDNELLGVCIGLKQYRDFVSNGKIKSVYYINLDSCDLDTIPEEIFTLKSLKRLSLEGNKINAIPEQIRDFETLEELSLRHNNIQSIPDSIGDLKNLHDLDLGYNQIKILPKSIVNLCSVPKRPNYRINSLFLAHNLIERLPPLFNEKFKGKWAINIEHNPLKENPFSISFQFDNIKDNKRKFSVDDFLKIQDLQNDLKNREVKKRES